MIPEHINHADLADWARVREKENSLEKQEEYLRERATELYSEDADKEETILQLEALIDSAIHYFESRPMLTEEEESLLTQLYNTQVNMEVFNG